MSVRINKNQLSLKEVNQIKNECFVEGAENSYGPSTKLRAYGETLSSMYIPFAYFKKKFGKTPNKEITYDTTNYSFNNKDWPFRIDGGRDQEVVFNSAIQLIKKYKSAMLSLHCGYGKCLGLNTPILMYDGSIKLVQDVIVGDLLMGDDSKSRTVLSLARGREEMYKVIQNNGDNYIVNESHILSLKQYNTNIIDISIKDFITRDNKSLLGYKVAIEFDSKNIDIDPYILGFWLGDGFFNKVYNETVINHIKTKLSKTKDFIDKLDYYNLINNKHVPNDFKLNSRDIRLQLLAGIIDATNSFKIFQNKLLINDVVFIARSVGLTVFSTNNSIVEITGNTYILPTIIVPRVFPTNFIKDHLTTPIRLEHIGIDDYYGFTINGNNRFLLGDFTVTHNTYEAIRLAQSSKFKCAVLAHRAVLFDQWKESIEKFTDAKVQLVQTDGILDPTADFYIFNIAFVHKQWDKKTKNWIPKKLGIYKEKIGILIVDEAHIACASEMSRALLYFNPRIVLALTATPVRKDGMDKALELYFGDYDKTRIIRVATDPFLVYRLATGIKPEWKMNAFGKKDWNTVIKSIVENEERNKLITDLIVKFDKYIILVLTKRTTHCKLLSKMLTELNITNSVMTGTMKKYDKNARVLLSTYSKLGVGFDDSRLNMLIVACSVTEVEQYAGRLRDSEGKNRIIIDMVDDDSSCLTHWSERRKWYISRNGNIQHYYKVFPKNKIEELNETETEKGDEIVKPKRLAIKLQL